MSAKKQDDFVTVAVLHDAVRAEMVVDLLREEGIETSASGMNHRALLGRIGAFIEIVVQVQRADAERARDIIETLEERGEIVDDREEARALEEDDDADDEERAQALAVAEGPYRKAAIRTREEKPPQMNRVVVFMFVGLVAVVVVMLLPALFEAFIGPREDPNADDAWRGAGGSLEAPPDRDETP